MTARMALTALLLSAAAAPAALDVPTRSVSSSRQFVIYATDPGIRSAVAIKAEDLKGAVLEALRAKDEWKLPIILNIGSTPPSAKRPPRFLLGIYEGDGGQAKVQFDVFDLGLLKEPEFQTQILTAILLEAAYRRTPPKAGRPFEPPPAWVVEGLAERIRSRDDDSRAGLYASLLSSANPPRLADFLGVQPGRLDATSRTIYCVQAAALLDAVLALPDGRTGLRQYLSVPHRSPALLSEVVAAFPSLGKDGGPLSRKWVLAIARASAANRVDLLDERETAKELDRLLAVKALPDPKHPEVASMSGPYALPAIARSQNGRFILAQAENGLLQLSLRAHPLYKSLVDEYLGITRDLIAKPKRRLDKRIATAEEIRAGLSRQTSEARDYLDWVEATKIKTENTDLSSTLQDIDNLEAAPSRTDAISRLLDAASERGW
ncbi:MAG: hypothetical protein PHC88_03625 [Terrimicrobiaceae bacterium]|nr:hypothetical protein [Terrimicrobiaceae bacterium]